MTDIQYGWISVKVKLPDLKKWVLTVRDSGHYSTPFEFMTGQCDPSYKGWVTPDNTRYTDSGEDPIYWRELPDLPSGLSLNESTVN